MPNTSTLPPTAELFQQIGYIADDDDCIKKLLKYAKRLTSLREEKADRQARFVASMKEALEELRLNREGKLALISEDELRDELRREGYYD